MSAAGGLSGVPSMENESGESGSSGGLGSDTSMFTSTAVRPLSRCGERGILAPAMRKAADGAASRAAASSGNVLAHCREQVVQVMPVIRLQPTPACHNIVLRDEYLEESLGAPFAADEGAVGFGKGSGRQNQLGLVRRRIGQVIENDHVRRGFQEGVHFGRGRTAVKIVFQDDYGVSMSILDRLECRAERTVHRSAPRRPYCIRAP